MPAPCVYSTCAGQVRLTCHAYAEVVPVKAVSPRACAVMVGLTLEAVCNHEQMPGKDLATRLRNLAAADRMPPTLA